MYMFATQMDQKEFADMHVDTIRVIETMMEEVQGRQDTGEKFAAVLVRLQTSDGGYVAGQLNRDHLHEYLTRKGFEYEVSDDDPDCVGHNTHALYILSW